MVVRAAGHIPVGFVFHYSSKAWSIMAGKGQQQEHEAAAQTERWMLVFSSLPHFYSVQDPSQEIVLPTFRVGFPILVNPF